MLYLAKPKFIARLLASNFPAENPRTQTRNVPYTKMLANIKKDIETDIKTLDEMILINEKMIKNIDSIRGYICRIMMLRLQL